ncbi:hypothetical protein BD324DRAFT_244905 [Kockovaella imperatae]|uniref:BTB domain-containing protein n=1 Tax=Kockovaella imperatae TaxID=4999 RepID=A0A1Y1UR72_9TREE|nr:hypothetical protein BD324DRAFT_244905 [Kockovaella imperatae]ORX39936.1 hypothetical protein BD324DRAFT_244905 [Kockovaella imperatae]
MFQSTKDLNDDLLVPPVPESPAPAYTALPHRDVDFFLAPLLNGQIGDIELETADGKRFLVHKKLLEQETVFFHIYYGFIPVWRLSNTSAGPPHPNIPAQAPSALGGLLNLSKIIASHIRASIEGDAPPHLPPKDPVTAPTPTTTPYTWMVPETSTILAAFLTLIYPRGTFATPHEGALGSLDITGRVIRAALGYQSAKALNAARDRMYHFIESQPLETYATASFFKFTDLARLASKSAVRIPSSQWSAETRQLMGKHAAARLENLQRARQEGLDQILSKTCHADQHSASCTQRPHIESTWRERVQEVAKDLPIDSDLLELLEVDLRGIQCGDCLMLLGTTIRESLYEARELPVCC